MNETMVARPVLDGARAAKDVAFDGYVRSGAAIEMKAFTGVSGDQGGYAIPKEIDTQIDATLKAASPIRSIAQVVQVGSAGYRKLVTTGGTHEVQADVIHHQSYPVGLDDDVAPLRRIGETEAILEARATAALHREPQDRGLVLPRGDRLHPGGGGGGQRDIGCQHGHGDKIGCVGRQGKMPDGATPPVNPAAAGRCSKPGSAPRRDPALPADSRRWSGTAPGSPRGRRCALRNAGAGRSNARWTPSAR